LLQLQKAGRLAGDLGATIRIIEPDKPPQILHDENASMVVAGYRRPKLWKSAFKSSFVDFLFENLDNVDVHFVELEGPSE
jgi:K+-sensing histidine kinase KdpD